MMAAVGVSDVDELFQELPSALRDPDIDLPAPLAEQDLVEHFRRLAAANASNGGRPRFLGAGAYRRFVPAVTAHLAGRSEFATAYTPYQPEISQGTLQSAFEFQSTVCTITGMEVANTGLYDGATATAEACLLASRVTRRRVIALMEPIHPNVVDVIRTYAFGADLEVRIVRSPDSLDAGCACLVIQQPDFLGTILDLAPLADTTHEHGALLVAMTDPFALGMLRPPGEIGADIVTGEGRDLAGPLSFGGPGLGIFAAKQEFVRQLPGHIVGRTRELRPRSGGEEPRTGYVLTLQAREQFIKRERATSNFSTGQALVALRFTITVQALGAEGFRGMSELCYQKAHNAARRIGSLPGYQIAERGPWFQEFLVRGPLPAQELQQRLRARGIEPGLDVSRRPEPEAAEATLICVTEATRKAEIESLVAALRAIGDEDEQAG
jgi:glycine cleavage system P protein (glycine dehydrogenase) subunit 1